jgi:hypothetical protein
MNALRTVFVLLAASLLPGQSPIIQSDSPLPPQLRQQLEREMAAAGLSASKQPDLFIKIHGVCRISMKSTSNERPLGWVERVDGQMLSIVHIDCQRISQALSRVVVNPQSAESINSLARAIARVARHEAWHLRMNNGYHERQGDYKAALRAEDLIAPFTSSL